MASAGPFAPGKPIKADVLNAVANQAAAIGERPPGIPGAGLPVGDQSAEGPIRVYVKSRATEIEAPLEEHGYVVTDGVNEYTLVWNQLIVMVQPGLVGPNVDPSAVSQLFVPAEVAGEGVAVSDPWRAWGLLFRGPSGDGSDADAAGVMLFGLSPHRGC